MEKVTRSSMTEAQFFHMLHIQQLIESFLYSPLSLCVFYWHVKNVCKE